jgi:hypothetical protein
MLIIGTVLVAVLVLLPVSLLAFRFARGGDSVAGGSFGRQFFGRKDDDWGPK